MATDLAPGRDEADLTRIEAQFLAAVAAGAECVETTAFRVHLWQTANPFYRNVAVPVRAACDRPEAIAEMRTVFERAGRVARLEFIDERWPTLAAALRAQAFRADGRMPVMTARSVPTAAPGDSAVKPLDAASPAEVMEGYLAAVHRAFDNPLDPRTLAVEIERLRAELAARRCLAAVALSATGEVLAGASLIGIGGGDGESAELAGVWTSAAVRGKGLGRAVCVAVMRDFFAANGRLVWLAASDSRARALYDRLGFRAIGHQWSFSALPP